MDDRQRALALAMAERERRRRAAARAQAAQPEPESPGGPGLGQFVARLNPAAAIGNMAAQSPGFVRGLRDPIDAGAQMLERAVPEGVRSSLNTFNDWLVDQGIPLKRLGPEGLQGQLNENEQAYQAGRAERGETGVDWGRIGGNVAGGLATGLAGAGPAAAASGALSRLAPGAAAALARSPAAVRIGQAALGGALGGALSEPVTGGKAEDFWAEKGSQAGIGALTGGALGGVLEGAGAIGRHVARPDMERLRQMGVQPTVGQALGGMVNRIEQKLTSFPIIGDAVVSGRKRALDEFNVGAINEALAPLKRKVTQSGQAGIDEAQDIVADAYAKAASQLPGFPVDQTSRGRVAMLRQGVADSAGKQAADDFERFMSGYFDRKLGNYPGLTREAFEEMDREINRRIRSNSGELQDAYRELRSIMLDAAERADPRYADLYRQARTAAARLMRIENAATRAAVGSKTEPGVFTPGQLILGSKAMDTSSRKRAVAAGEGLMQDVGTAGQRVLGDTVPTSGTAERLMTSAGPAAAIGGIGGATLGLPALAGLAVPWLGATRISQKAIVEALRRLQAGKAGALPGILSGQQSGGMTGGGF